MSNIIKSLEHYSLSKGSGEDGDDAAGGGGGVHPILSNLQSLAPAVDAAVKGGDAGDALKLLTTSEASLLSDRGVRSLAARSDGMGVILGAVNAVFAMPTPNLDLREGCVGCLAGLLQGQPDLLGPAVVEESILAEPVAENPAISKMRDIAKNCGLGSTSETPAVLCKALKVIENGCIMHERNRWVGLDSGPPARARVIR